MKVDKISINGKLLNPSIAKIKALDQGFMYGLSVFETFRLSQNKVFLWNEHLQRLNNSLSALDIKHIDYGYARHIIFDLTKDTTHTQDNYIKFMVTAGEGELGIASKEFLSPSIVAYSCLIPKLTPMHRQAKILQKVQRHYPEYFKQVGFRIKLSDYSQARVAQKELGRKEGIMLSPKGIVAEGLTSNVFWARDGQLYTSPLSLGILPGIIREYLIKTNNVIQAEIKAKDLELADEIFLTNSASYLAPLSKINSLKKPGMNGPIFKSLFEELKIKILSESCDLSR